MAPSTITGCSIIGRTNARRCWKNSVGFQPATPLQRWLFDRLNAFVDKRLANDVERCLPSAGRPAEFTAGYSQDS